LFIILIIIIFALGFRNDGRRDHMIGVEGVNTSN